MTKKAKKEKKARPNDAPIPMTDGELKILIEMASLEGAVKRIQHMLLEKMVENERKGKEFWLGVAARTGIKLERNYKADLMSREIRLAGKER